MQLDFDFCPGGFSAKVGHLIGFVTEGECIVEFDDPVLLETEDIIEIKLGRQRPTDRIRHALRGSEAGNGVRSLGIVPEDPFL